MDPRITYFCQFKNRLLELEADPGLADELHKFRNIYLRHAVLNPDNHFAAALLFYIHAHPYVRYVDVGGKTCYLYNPDTRLWEERTPNHVSVMFHEMLNHLAETARQFAAEREKNAKSQEERDKWANDVAVIKKLTHKKWIASSYFGQVRNYISVFCEDLDFPKQLNVFEELVPLQGGKVLNLRTGQLSQRTREHYFSVELPVQFVDQADFDGVSTEIAESFFRSVFLDSSGQPDQQLIDFMQRWCGYVLTGCTKEQKFLILYETGSNGKTMLLTSLEQVMGPMFLKAPEEMFVAMRTRSAGAHTDYLTRLLGKRLAVFEETNAEDQLNEAQIKSLTGSSTISARKAYGSQIEFTSYAKYIICTNHKPEVSTDPAIWRRLIFVPCRAKFVDDPIPNTNQRKMDRDLKAKLSTPEYRRAFFKFYALGARQYYEQGLREPESVKAAVRAYQDECDIVGSFLRLCTRMTGEPDPDPSDPPSAKTFAQLDRSDLSQPSLATQSSVLHKAFLDMTEADPRKYTLKAFQKELMKFPGIEKREGYQKKTYYNRYLIKEVRGALAEKQRDAARVDYVAGI